MTDPKPKKNFSIITPILILILSIFIYHHTQNNPLPFPYNDGSSPQTVNPERLSRLPGGSSSPLPIDLIQSIVVVPNDDNNNNKDWRMEMKRLFEGEGIIGSESVQVVKKKEKKKEDVVVVEERNWRIGRGRRRNIEKDMVVEEEEEKKEVLYSLFMIDRGGYLHEGEARVTNTWKDADYELLPTKSYIGPGRHLGFHVNPDGNSIISCNSLTGLVRINLRNDDDNNDNNNNNKKRVESMEVLSNMADDTQLPINYANDLDISEQYIYFSSSTEGIVGYQPDGGYYDTFRSYLLNLLKGDATGRLLRYNTNTKQTETLLDGLWYANGVALAHDDSYVLIVETSGFRVLKLYLKDIQQTTDNDNDDEEEEENQETILKHKTGEVETLIDRLWGVPDGITRSTSNPNTFWISLLVKPSPLFHLAKFPMLRRMLSHVVVALSPFLREKASRWTGVVRVDGTTGEIVQAMVDDGGEMIRYISAVTEVDGGGGQALFLGNLSGDYVTVLPLR